MRWRPAIVPLLLLASVGTAHAQRQSKESLDAIGRWVQAVNEHQPGQPDGAVARIAAMTFAARRDLNTAYPLFMRTLTGREVVVTRSEIDKAVTRMARVLRADPGTAVFLKRAALLHLDALVFARKFPRPLDDAPPPTPTKETIDGISVPIPADRRPPPLLRNERVVLTRDGQVLGDTPADWNLPFARSLLEEFFLRRQDPVTGAPETCSEEVAEALRLAGRSIADCMSVFSGSFAVSAADIEFAGAWYHAAAAYLFATGMNGDATDHLQDGARVLPDDPRVLFDRGTYAETLGLPIYQVVQQAAEAKPNRFIARIPAEDKTNADAERLYRRTLEVDPRFHEARLRLARLLEWRGQIDEASTQIAQVLEQRPAGVIGFYALTIAGRIAVARGRYRDALDRYRQAAATYRGAQSALLGASHAALMLANVGDALEPLREIGADSASDTDPWHDYQLGAGRDVNALLSALWSSAAR